MREAASAQSLMDVYLFLLAVAYGILFILFVSCGVRMGHWIGCHIGDVVPSRYKPVHQAEHDRIQILVLGDIGRSPRMQYHGISVMKHGRKVDLVGYKGSSHCRPRPPVCRPRAHPTLTLVPTQTPSPVRIREAPESHRQPKCCLVPVVSRAHLD